MHPHFYFPLLGKGLIIVSNLFTLCCYVLLGEVLRVMDRGTQSINNLLNYILFSIVPTLVDVGVAVVYFVIAFDIWFGLIVFTTMISYIYFTISVTEWRTKFRRSVRWVGVSGGRV